MFIANKKKSLTYRALSKFGILFCFILSFTTITSSILANNLNSDVYSVLETVINELTFKHLSKDNIDAAAIVDMSNSINKEILDDLKSRVNGYLIKNIYTTTIKATDYDMEYNENNAPIGVKVKTLSPLGLSFLNSTSYNDIYKLIEGDKTHLQLVNGFYKIQNLGSEFYYAIDGDGNILTGFVAVNNQNLLSTDTLGKLSVTSKNEPGIYYFCADDGPYRGILWTSNLQLGKILYSFDDTGKLLSAVKSITDDDNTYLSSGSWDFNSKNGKWSFYHIDSNGNKTFAKDGCYKIEGTEGPKYYIFDKDGYMMTGLVKYNGNTYYLQETGPNRGAIYTGSIVINGTPYEFDEHGVMKNSMGKRMKTTNDKKYTN